MPKKLVLHVIGSEREADLIPILPVLLALLPGMEIVIVLFGPEVFHEIQESMRHFKFASAAAGSKLEVHLVSGVYEKEYVLGTGMTNIDHGKPNVRTHIRF